ncbi:replicative DNA helicase [Rhizobium tibeticum]|uniref:hypothetical protein n=1 Tax=Rhizobium tibeticum TaxID=501024 RepID=UPI00277FCE3D|nr:hypothetical protein [Rhizobium tibeticum]MDP9813861.1 replicative DNA helicase [Rhizobium tibeticum]
MRLFNWSWGAVFAQVSTVAEAKKGLIPITVRSFMPPQVAMSKDMTVVQYLARLAMVAVNVMNVLDFADTITGYFNCREAMRIADEAYFACAKARDELEFIERIKECSERLTAIVTSVQERNEPTESFRYAIDKTLDSTAEAMSGR